MDEKSSKTFLDSFISYVNEDFTSFDVPGHHLGNINNRLTDFLGKKIFKCDMNAPYGLDNLAHPKGVILESENAMARFCKADRAFFLINGTSSGLIASIMVSCKPTDKIILPRNVHKSITNALVVSGAIPVYVSPLMDTNIEIANQPTLQDYIKAIKKYPSAKAVIVINPTYYGSISNLKEIVEYAHSKNMIVIVDEAHGAHYYFSDLAPYSAMRAGADLAAVSFHKTAGSLTQTSVLLLKGDRIPAFKIQETLNLINTTSPNSIFLASLDAAREYAEVKGQYEYQRILKLYDYAFEQINKIPGFIVRGEQYFKSMGSFDYDKTKLLIELDRLDINGFEIFRLLHAQYHIQVELGESYVFLCVLALGTTEKHIENLIKALKSISKTHFFKNLSYPTHKFTFNYGYMLVRPRTAFYANGKKVSLDDALNHIAKESIIIYPPGIPLIQPGEIFNKDIIAHIKDGLKKECTLLSNYPNAEYVDIIDEVKWKRFNAYQKRLDDYVKNEITTSERDGFTLNFEGDAHFGTIILLPYRKDVWTNKGKEAIGEFKKIISSIAKYEKVFVVVDPSIYSLHIGWINQIPNTVILKVKYNDAWARDNTLLFVKNYSTNEIRAVDYRFNAWGGEFDGLYSNYQNDDYLGRALSKKLHLKTYFIPNFILEGGSVVSDGQGTLITTEACLLSKGRNPHLNKNEIEEVLKNSLGVSEVIWLPRGIIGDETNEHVDNFACFSKPGEVLLAWPSSNDNEQYSACVKALKILENSIDAKGRKIKVIKVKMPSLLVTTKEESKAIKKDKFSAKPRLEGDKLCGSYINFYMGEEYVLLPQFGVKEDKNAIETFKQIFPNKNIIPIYSRNILVGGGNIHCVTMQIPKGEIK